MTTAKASPRFCAACARYSNEPPLNPPCDACMPPTGGLRMLTDIGQRMDAQRAQDKIDGIVRIGGRFSAPDYSGTYRQAAGVVIDWATSQEKLKSFALVCAYLQRHAVELLLKELYYQATVIHKFNEERQGRKDTSKDNLFGHDLPAFLNATRAALQRVQLPLPPQLNDLVSGLTALEAGDETRLRYPLLKDGKTRSFDDQEVLAKIPVWQRLLNEIEEQHLGAKHDYWKRPHTEWNLAEQIDAEFEAIAQADQYEVEIDDEMILPRSRRQSVYAASGLDFNCNSNSTGLT